MKLILTRKSFLPDRTLGTLQCGPLLLYTLEDQVRQDPFPQTPENEAKVMHQTAIPAGEYDLIIDFSQRFQRELPHILNVPGFVGVRIHPGNTPQDTSGCVLVGRSLGADNTIRYSRLAFDEMFELLEGAYDEGKTLSILITNDGRT